MHRSRLWLILGLIVVAPGTQAVQADAEPVCLICGWTGHASGHEDPSANLLPTGDPPDVTLSFHLPSTAILTCDLNGDLVCNCADIDLMTLAIGEGRDSPIYDLNQDGVVDPGDREFLLEDLMGVPYGDSNLDGVFDSSDLVLVFSAGHYNDPNVIGILSYCEGDWNGDGIFDSADLVLAFQDGYEPSAEHALAVPEPAIWIGVWLAAATVAATARRRSRRD